MTRAPAGSKMIISVSNETVDGLIAFDSAARDAGAIIKTIYYQIPNLIFQSYPAQYFPINIHTLLS